MRKLKSNFSNQICNYCKKNFHIKKDCYKLQIKEKLDANQKERQSKTSGEANVVENCFSDKEHLVISDGDSKPEEVWIRILDIVCNFQMCLNRNLFSTYEEFGKVL